MLLAVLAKVGQKLGRVLGRGDDVSSQATKPDPSPAPGSSDDPREAAAETLCGQARAEPDPFRRDAMFRDVARIMVELYAIALRRYCEVEAGDGADADDLAQRACLIFWEKLPGFEGRSRLRSFLFGIAHNLCRQIRRDGRRNAALLERHHGAVLERVHPEPETTLDETLDTKRRRMIVLAAFDKLDPKEAWLIRQRLVAHLDYRDILPLYRREFGDQISTTEGLRTAFFHAKKRLLLLIEKAQDGGRR